MWKRAFSLLFFLLLKGHQGQGCSDTIENVTAVSGKPLCLRPNDTWTENFSCEWKKLMSQPGSFALIGDECKRKYPDLNSKNLNKQKFELSRDNLTLTIKSPGPQDSSRYVLEMTNNNGTLCTKKFNVTILDPVEKPYLEGEWKALANGTCQLSLYCLVSRDDNVTYALYNASTRIATERNFTISEKQTNVTGLYTCNVSNEVSWESHTLNFTQGCLSVTLTYEFLPLLVVIIILVVLFLGALFICMWDKKRRQSQPDPKEFLTVYEDVKGQSRSLSAGLENESGQRELDSMEQMHEQTPPGEVATIYAMIQRQPSASTPRETSTLYSVIQPFKKHGSKKSNHSPSFNCTVYEEVGKKHFNAYNPARLSSKELENFEVYF